MKKYLLITIATLLFLSGCVSDLKNRELGSQASADKILFAGVKSKFKAQVIAKVIEDLGADNCFIKITGLDNLKNEDPVHYKAVVLINTLMAGQLDKRVKEFLTVHPDNEKVILFTTAGGGKYNNQYKVDAISSASGMGRVDQIAGELVDLIRNRM